MPPVVGPLAGTRWSSSGLRLFAPTGDRACLGFALVTDQRLARWTPGKPRVLSDFAFGLGARRPERREIALDMTHVKLRPCTLRHDAKRERLTTIDNSGATNCPRHLDSQETLLEKEPTHADRADCAAC